MRSYLLQNRAITYAALLTATAGASLGQSTQPGSALPDAAREGCIDPMIAPDRRVETRNLFGLPAAPLDEPIATDRPDFTETAEAVPYGHIQVESGYTFTYDREHDNRTRDHTAPELLFRLGLFKDSELRIGWLGYSWHEDLFETETRRGRRVSKEDWGQGAYDLSLGFKYHLWDQKGLRPSFGVIAETTTPSGSSEISSEDVDPQIKGLWSYELTETWSLAGNLNLGTPTEGTHRFFQTSNSVSLAKSWTDWLGSYFEYFGFYPNTQHTDCAHYLDGGFTFLLNPNLQLDIRAGFGLNEEADDFFSGAGVSFRF